MEKQLSVVNIIQGQVGSVQLTEIGEDKKRVDGAPVVTIQFKDPAEAAKFVHGKKYNVAFIAAE